MLNVNELAGGAVAKRRKSMHMPQEELAKYLGVTRTSVSNIERGKQAMSLAMFCKVSECLHVSPDILLSEVINPEHAIITLVTKEDAPETWVRDEINNLISSSLGSNFKVVKGGSYESKKN